MSSSITSALFGSGLGGSTIGGAVVKLGLDDTALNKGLAEAEAKTKGSADTMGGTWSKFKTLAAGAYVAVGVAAVAFAAKSIEVAIAAEQANLKLANSIANSATVTKDAIPVFDALAHSVSDLTGVHSDAITAMQAFLVQMKLTQSEVETLTPLVVDLSVKQGIDLTTAAKAVGKAVNGTTGGLSRMGVVVDKTAAKTDAYGATLKALSVVQGFAAQSAKAEPWKLLTNQIHELELEVGQALVPALQAIVPILTDIVKHAKPAFTLLANIITTTTEAGIQNPTMGGGTSPLDAMFGVGFSAKAIGGTKILKDYTTQLDLLIQAYKDGVITAPVFNQAVGDLLKSVGQSPDVFGTATDFTVLYQERIAATSVTVTALTESSNAAAAATKHLKDSFHETGQGLLALNSTIKSTFAETPAQLEKAFAQMLAVTVRWKADEEKALKLKPGSFGIDATDMSKFLRFLEADSPGALDAFLRANHSAQNQMIASWEAAMGNVSGRIRGGFPGTIVVSIVPVGGAPGGGGRNTGRSGGRVHVPVNGP
jgi:hypothetical protein